MQMREGAALPHGHVPVLLVCECRRRLLARCAGHQAERHLKCPVVRSDGASLERFVTTVQTEDLTYLHPHRILDEDELDHFYVCACVYHLFHAM